MSQRVYVVTARMTEKEKAMVDALSKSYGDITSSDVLRRCVQERFIKAFPANKPNKSGAGVPEHEMTQEQICEALGGRVVKKDGGYVCVGVNGVTNLTVPLTLMGHKGEAGDYRINR